MTYCENVQHHTYTTPDGRAWEWYSDVLEHPSASFRTPLFHQQIPSLSQSSQTQPGLVIARLGLCQWAIQRPVERQVIIEREIIQAAPQQALPPPPPEPVEAGLGLVSIGAGLFLTLALSSMAVLTVLSKVGNQRHAKQ